MLTLYITRHGETVWNKEKRMQGWSNSDLTENGICQAVELGKYLSSTPFDAIYCSPSGRTQQTAHFICGEREVPIILEEKLKEIHMGDWEGKTHSFIEKNYPAEHYSFWNTPHLYSSEKGESFFALQDRVMEVLERIQKEHHSGNILIVTHAVVIKTMLALFKGVPLEKVWDPPFIHGTSLSVVEISPTGKKIVVEGDISHYRLLES